MRRGLIMPLMLAAAAGVAAPASASVGPPPTSCQNVATANPSATDGDYTIYPNGETFTVYCADMPGAPKEYLTLPNTGTSNFSTDVFWYDQVVTDFAKVRLDPATLRVDINDARFSTSSGTVYYGNSPFTQMPYAEAADCVSDFSSSGTGNVDLRGTSFAVNDSFVHDGWNAAGSSTFSANNQVVDLTGGGYCGGTHPVDAPNLQLAYLGTTYGARPVLTPAVSGTSGNNGWYTSDVAVSWSSDQPMIASEGCGNQAVTSDTAGVTLTCTASGPGGVSTRSVTVKRDATKPVVTLGGGGTYTVADTVTITCSATDALSGVATSNCDGLAGSKPAYDYALGDTTITATATDQAGNTATNSATVTVVDTPASLQTLVSSFSTSPGVAGALNGKLDSIAQAPNGQAKAGKVGAFINQVNAQTGKALTAAQAATLIRLVEAL